MQEQISLNEYTMIVSDSLINIKLNPNMLDYLQSHHMLHVYFVTRVNNR